MLWWRCQRLSWAPINSASRVKLRCWIEARNLTMVHLETAMLRFGGPSVGKKNWVGTVPKSLSVRTRPRWMPRGHPSDPRAYRASAPTRENRRGSLGSSARGWTSSRSARLQAKAKILSDSASNVWTPSFPRCGFHYILFNLMMKIGLRCSCSASNPSFAVVLDAGGTPSTLTALTCYGGHPLDNRQQTRWMTTCSKMNGNWTFRELDKCCNIQILH